MKPWVLPTGWPWRWASAAEEVDDLPEGSAAVFPPWRWLSLQHHPGHVCPEAHGGQLGKHRLLRRLHFPVVRDERRRRVRLCLSSVPKHDALFSVCRYKGASGSSAVCAFSMAQVEAAFSGRYREVNRETQQWYTYNHPVPEPRPGAVSRGNSNQWQTTRLCSAIQLVLFCLFLLTDVELVKESEIPTKIRFQKQMKYLLYCTQKGVVVHIFFGGVLWKGYEQIIFYLYAITFWTGWKNSLILTRLMSLLNSYFFKLRLIKELSPTGKMLIALKLSAQPHYKTSELFFYYFETV